MTEEHYQRLLTFYREHHCMEVGSREYREECRRCGIDADEIYDNQMSLEMDYEFGA